MQYVWLYLLTTPVFFLVDMVWLGFIANGFYRKYIGSLLRTEVNWTAAIVFYLIFIAGIIYFAVVPGIEKRSMMTVLVNAALFGGMAYATYDLTNLATLKGWSVTLSMADIAWGICLSTIVAAVSYRIALWLI